MAPHRMVTITLVALGVTTAFADDLLYRYEGDVLPYDPSAGWLNGLCEDPCSESLEDGHFVLRWPFAGDLANYHLWIARAEDPPPPSTLWVEWRFRSNHPLGRFFVGCDAHFTVNYAEMHDIVQMYGDAAISFSGDDWITGLDIDEFHTYRFESLDSVNYTVSVDGLVFMDGIGFSGTGSHYLQFGGRGGCIGDQIPNMVNEWDFIRYGTISFSEKIVASDPPGGFLDPRRYPSLDRFTVTFDSPNYVYLDEITVEMSDTPSCLDQENLCPTVVQTRRLDNGDPEVVEIVLDQPIPTDGRTVFTLSDGVAINTVQYTYIQGDVNADGAFDLADVAGLGNCFGVESPTGRCYAFDFDDNGLISLSDYAILHALLTGP